jgi:hypothetical protein
MKWIGGISFSSHVIGKMVIAVAAFIFCPCLTIKSSAQIGPQYLCNIETEQTSSRDPAPDIIGRRARRIYGGILNLDSAVIVTLRESKLVETRTSEPEVATDPASTSNGDSDDSGEKSKLKAEPDKPRDSRDDSFQPLPDYALDQDLLEGQKRTSFDWNAAFRQSMIFLGIQHAFRLATEAGTRAELKGPFFKDYFKTLGNLRGWNDGDPFLVNYIGHPMMGSVTGFIQVQNDPKGIAEEVSLKKSYWRSRLKAFSWSFAYSTQFELGLFGEAGVGNIGIRPYGKAKHPMAYVDIVVTPVVGTGWLVGEDMIDRYLIRRLEKTIRSRVVQIVIRGFLNPTRSFANLIRGKKPWHRDNRE